MGDVGEDKYTEPPETTTVWVWYNHGDPVFIFAALGFVGMLEEMEASLGEWFSEGEPDETGNYQMEMTWEPAQIGEEGRTEIEGYWYIKQIGFKGIDEEEKQDGR